MCVFVNVCVCVCVCLVCFVLFIIIIILNDHKNTTSSAPQHFSKQDSTFLSTSSLPPQIRHGT